MRPLLSLAVTESAMTIAAPQSAFAGNHFRIRQKFSFLFREYVVEHRSGCIVGYARQEPFRLKTGVHLYQDETTETELLYVKKRAVFESSANYDVIDSTTGQPLGIIRRSFWGSMVLKEWTVIDALGQEIGTIATTPPQGFFGRREYVLDFGVNGFGIASPMFTPFSPKLSLDLSAIQPEKVDRRLAIAFGLLLIVTRPGSR